jgi:hypothetical protein
LRKTICFPKAIEAHVTFPHIDGEIRGGRHHMQVRIATGKPSTLLARNAGQAGSLLARPEISGFPVLAGRG